MPRYDMLETLLRVIARLPQLQRAAEVDYCTHPDHTRAAQGLFAHVGTCACKNSPLCMCVCVCMGGHSPLGACVARDLCAQTAFVDLCEALSDGAGDAEVTLLLDGLLAAEAPVRDTCLEGLAVRSTQNERFTERRTCACAELRRRRPQVGGRCCRCMLTSGCVA
jgi:hypothetical protein